MAETDHCIDCRYAVLEAEHHVFQCSLANTPMAHHEVFARQPACDSFQPLTADERALRLGAAGSAS
jgi:hypothetical protein